MASADTGVGKADPITLAALGVLAYLLETLLHEAIGHGSVCLLDGGKITLLSQLYMRCSISSPAMVAAGPAANVVAAIASFALLRRARGAPGAGQFFLWLCLVFNALIAAGYLLVGAATGFGDWSVLFAGIHPDWQWRVPAGIVALVAYGSGITITERCLRRMLGLVPDKATVARLVLIPTGAAAVVAIAAEILGEGGPPLQIALAAGCTAVVGATLMGIGGGPDAKPLATSRLRIGLRAAIVVFALAAAAGYLAAIAPGADLSAL